MRRTLGLLTVGLVVIALFSTAEAGMWGPRQSGRIAVTVYEHAHFSGRQATFYGDTAWLPHGISSIRVEGRCTVTLYSDYGFRGRRQEITSDVPNLEGSRVGNDRVMSLTISEYRPQPPSGPPPSRPPRPVPRQGEVILYEHADFKGRSLQLTGDINNLRKTRLGNNVISSILIRGAEVTVYEHPGFAGRNQTFDRSVRSLRGTRIGNDTISSIRIRWIDEGPGHGGFKQPIKGTAPPSQ